MPLNEVARLLEVQWRASETLSECLMSQLIAFSIQGVEEALCAVGQKLWQEIKSTQIKVLPQKNHG